MTRRLWIVVGVVAAALIIGALTVVLSLSRSTSSPEGVDSPPPPEVPGWQLDESNTGLAVAQLQCEDLPVYEGPQRPAAGAVISQQRIDRPMILSAGDITIENSCIQPLEAGRGLPILTTTNPDTGDIATAPVTIRNSELDGSRLPKELAASTTAFLGVANLYRNNIHGFGSGIGFMNTGRSLSAIVEGNYVHDLRAWGDPATTGNHSDAFTVRDFAPAPNRSLVTRGNRFDCDSGNDTGAYFIQTYAGDISNLTVEKNLLEGGGYQLVLGGGFGNTYSNVRAIDNRMSGTGFGPGYVQEGTPGWSEQRENFLNDPQAAQNRGDPVDLQ